MQPEIVAAIIAVVGTLAGVVVSHLIGRDSRKIAMMERRIERYRSEIRSRMAQEDVASSWIVELGGATSIRAAKVQLREKTETKKGVRPSIAPSEVR